MASKVPKFGAWEGGENYTVYFDNARKGKKNGPMINPNDPEENPSMFKQNGAPPQAPPDHKRAESQGQQSKVPQFGAWDNGDNAGYTVYFENARKTKNNGGPQTNDQNEEQNKRDPPTQARPASVKPEPHGQPRSKVPQFGGWDQAEGEVGYTACFDNVRKSKNGPTTGTEGPQLNRDVGPNNEDGRSKAPQFGGWNEGESQNVAYTAYFDKVGKNKGPTNGEPQLNRVVADQAARANRGAAKARSEEHLGPGGARSRPEQRANREEAGHSRNGSRGSVPSQSPLHPSGGRSQPKANSRGSLNAEKAASIPQFGVWNNTKNPGAGEGFTGAFTRAKEERNTPLHNNTPASYQQHANRTNQDAKKGCCFPWFG